MARQQASASTSRTLQGKHRPPPSTAPVEPPPATSSATSSLLPRRESESERSEGLPPPTMSSASSSRAPATYSTSSCRVRTCGGAVRGGGGGGNSSGGGKARPGMDSEQRSRAPVCGSAASVLAPLTSPDPHNIHTHPAAPCLQLIARCSPPAPWRAPRCRCPCPAARWPCGRGPAAPPCAAGSPAPCWPPAVVQRRAAASRGISIEEHAQTAAASLVLTSSSQFDTTIPALQDPQASGPPTCSSFSSPSSCTLSCWMRSYLSQSQYLTDPSRPAVQR